MEIATRLKALRKAMKQASVEAVIVPSSDPHMSEYVADHWKAREWISEFTGSAGVVVVTNNHAGLWTDARYFIQAEQELSASEFKLHRVTNQFAPQHIEWLNSHLPKGSKVSIDGKVISESLYQRYRKSLRADLEMVIKYDLIGEIWDERPDLPEEEIFIHDQRFTGKGRGDKLTEVIDAIERNGADFAFFTALDDIGYLLNLRGRDVECNPVFIAYLLVGKNQSTLYVDNTKVNRVVNISLANEGVVVKDYETIVADLNAMPENARVLVDTNQINTFLYRSINGQAIPHKSVAKWSKARKTHTEIEHFRNCMEKDGAALAEAFYWLEDQLKTGTVREKELADKIAERRSAKELYYGESFYAIVGYKENGAIMHYRPPSENSSTIHQEGMLLVDSGGQYHDGTTDITRTFHLSNPSAEQKKHWTLVLKGMIALTNAIFPAGTPGGQLDTLARQYLWQEGLNFGHGTGHGVGFFMNVHEPPQGFATIHSERGQTPIQQGMVTSNEPGFYLEGNYGIRIENLVVAQPAQEGYLKFETLTLYPFAHNLMDRELLTHGEIGWINNYHREAYNRIAPWIDDDKIRTWFKGQCAPL